MYNSLKTKLFLRIFRSRITEDFLFLLAVTLAAGFYSYEKSLPYQIHIQISWLLTFSVILAWIWVSFVSGFMRRGSFLFISLSFWVVPQFIIIGYINFAETDYNAVFHIASRISELLVWAPLFNIAEHLRISEFYIGIGLLLIYEIMFFIGILYRGTCRKSGWYCDFRERYEV
jgi:hypothetical protein